MITHFIRFFNTDTLQHIFPCRFFDSKALVFIIVIATVNKILGSTILSSEYEQALKIKSYNYISLPWEE